jgi:predicted ATPase
VPLGQLNVITGANGSGKSNLYRALKLLADTAHRGLIRALAFEGGLTSVFWAGTPDISRRMRRGEVPAEGAPGRGPRRLRLGFAGDDFGYAISLGTVPTEPGAKATEFELDPDIKRETVWTGPLYRPGSWLVDRDGAVVTVRRGRERSVIAQHLRGFQGLLSEVTDAQAAPELVVLRARIGSWRFYDQMRTDRDAPARQPQLGTLTPVLHHDGRDLAAALQTILEIGDPNDLHRAIDDAFPGTRLHIAISDDRRFDVELHHEGLLRPLKSAELSDGTLRYLLWTAALLTPRPPPLLVLNEPETSLHDDLLPPLARLIGHAAKNSQVWVISHAPRLLAELEAQPGFHPIALERCFGQTAIVGQEPLDEPPWRWPDGGR